MDAREITKKPWSTPELIVHGDVARLTGWIVDPTRMSATGTLASQPSPS